MFNMKKKQLIKNKCEIDDCNITDPDALHFHHIIERTQINTSNHPQNLAILCASHHSLVHAGKLKIICVYPSTEPPNNRVLLYELNGKKNIEGLDSVYLEFKNKSYKI